MTSLDRLNLKRFSDNERGEPPPPAPSVFVVVDLEQSTGARGEPAASGQSPRSASDRGPTRRRRSTGRANKLFKDSVVSSCDSVEKRFLFA